MTPFFKLALSNNAPDSNDTVWLRPVEGGVTLYVAFNGKWQPLKLVDNGDTTSLADDVTQNLVGSVSDKKTANTINGAKAYAKDQADSLLGSNEDVSTDMTLYGLKAYIDAKTAG